MWKYSLYILRLSRQPCRRYLSNHTNREPCSAWRKLSRNSVINFSCVRTEEPRRKLSIGLRHRKAKAIYVLQSRTWCQYSRLFSSMKDGEGKDSLGDKESDSENDLNIDTINDLDRLEKMGFTSDEVIEILKNAKEFDEKYDTSDSSDSDSVSENSEEFENATNANSGDKVKTENQIKGQDGNGVVKENKSEKQDERQSDVTETKGDDWAVVRLKQDFQEDWKTVEVEDFVNFVESEPDVEDTWVPPVDLVRGETGVYDIEDLVTLLRAVNAVDIMTVRVPAELDFCDYMVIASAKSQRHMQAIVVDVKWIHKRRKNSSDKFLKIEGEKTDWYAMDIGNIVLHLFMPDKRMEYDLETLWAVGVKYDPLCVVEPKDPYVFSVGDLPWLQELEQAAENSEQQDDSSGNVDKKGQQSS